MLDKEADNVTKQSQQMKGTYLEHSCFEMIRDVHQTIGGSSLSEFTLSRIDSLWQDLNVVVQSLERLPEESFKALIEVIVGLREARNELRLTRFLFDLEEINPVYCLVMRNRAVLRGQEILRKLLLVWPLQSSQGRPVKRSTK